MLVVGWPYIARFNTDLQDCGLIVNTGGPPFLEDLSHTNNLSCLVALCLHVWGGVFGKYISHTLQNWWNIFSLITHLHLGFIMINAHIHLTKWHVFLNSTYNKPIFSVKWIWKINEVCIFLCISKTSCTENHRFQSSRIIKWYNFSIKLALLEKNSSICSHAQKTGSMTTYYK